MRQRQSASHTLTYRTRVVQQDREDEILCAYSALMNCAKRTLYAALCTGHSPGELKSRYLKEFGITARQFNSIRVDIEGMIASVQERQKGQLKLLDSKIASLERFLKRAKPERQAFITHQKKRRLVHLTRKREKLAQQLAEGKTSICFGSRKLFHSQFDPVANGFATHDHWRADWVAARSSNFFILGSKDETSGNQTVTAMLQEDGSLSLRLRLPNALSQYGKYLTLTSVRFAYGHDHIVAALHDNSPVAFSYRFLRDRKGWTIFLTLPFERPTIYQSYLENRLYAWPTPRDLTIKN